VNSDQEVQKGLESVAHDLEDCAGELMASVRGGVRDSDVSV